MTARAGLVRPLAPRVEAVFRLVGRYPGRTIAELAAETDIPVGTIRNSCSVLCANGLVTIDRVHRGESRFTAVGS